MTKEKLNELRLEFLDVTKGLDFCRGNGDDTLFYYANALNGLSRPEFLDDNEEMGFTVAYIEHLADTLNSDDFDNIIMSF